VGPYGVNQEYGAFVGSEHPPGFSRASAFAGHVKGAVVG